jgi:hypothetical protein
MRVNPFLMPVLLIAALLGSVFVAQAAGAWSVTGRTTVDLNNLAPADIKGWMTLQQVMEGVGISKEALYALVGLPADMPTSTALKDLEKLVPGFETSTLRDALIARAGGATPPPAANAQPTLQPTVQAATPTAHATRTALPAGEVLPADQIKGRMSLREVSEQCSVPLDRLYAALNLPPDTAPDSLIKDLVAQGTLSEVSAVQQAVASIQQQE